MDINSNYYNQKAKEFIEDTFKCDMSVQYNLFLKHLTPNTKILDLGFGSARDMMYFKNNGYDVVGIDPTEKFVENAKELGFKVYNITAQQMTFDNEFDGIWACASLLHVPTSELNDVFKKCYNALKSNGYLYASFKYGEYEGERNGRVFTDMTEAKLDSYLKDTNLKIVDMLITGDVREGRISEKWLNVILKK